MEPKEQKMKQLFQEHKIDGAIVSSPENFHYVTGFASHQHTVSRQPTFASVIVSKKMDVPSHIIVMDFELPALTDKNTPFMMKKYDTWVGVQKWDDVLNNISLNPVNNMQFSIDVVKNTLKEMNLANGTIGIEMDFVSINYYHLLKETFPEVTFVDVSPLFLFSRSVKTEEEIMLFKQLTEVADKSLNVAKDLIKVGNTERQVAQKFREHVVSSGVCAPSAWSTFNTGSNSSRLCLPGERSIRYGDIFKFDGGVNAEFDFYTTDTSRGWIVGNADPVLHQLKDRLYEAQRKMIDVAKPGLPINELFRIGFEHVKKRYNFYKRGHLGHSISLGPQTAEPPFINNIETRSLEPGMILAIEVPCYIEGVGGFNIEDMVLITEHGSENLTYRTPHYL